MSGPILEDLDAVGPARAELLREHGFESVQSLIEATPAKLVEIDGIGEATATDILASVVRVLDRSEPTVETPRLQYTTPTFGPLPFPRPTTETSTETPAETSPDGETMETPTVTVQRVVANGTVIETMAVSENESVEIRTPTNSIVRTQNTTA